ncbi:retrovirus-related pol polyprotein from transposon TNT 1-94 [Tanacetum coccineum]
MTHPHPNRRFVPQAVLTRSGKINTASASVNTVVRPVNTAGSKTTVNHPRPISNVYKKGYSQVTRPFNKYSANKNSIFNKKVNTVRVKDTTARDRAVVSENKEKGVNAVKASACWVWKAKNSSASNTFKKYSYIDARGRSKATHSGCSRHMTGNKCYLTEYEDYDGGFVSFGMGKGLEFLERNNVPFTDTECLVLSSDFKLLDESQVLLRVPRKDNIIVFNMLLCAKMSLVKLACITKTSYELICRRTPLIDFMKPFGCPVTILNTRDYLGKFNGKDDEGFFVGYYVVSKAVRVFNKRTRIVKETLNIRFLENAPNVIGNGPDWLFDVDSLTISMNYVPVIVGNKTNGIAGTRDNIVVGQAEKKTKPEQEYILIPFCTTDPLISPSPKDSKEDIGMKPIEVNESGASNKGEEDEQDTRSEFERLIQQEKHPNSTNSIDTISTDEPSSTNDASSSPVNAAKTFEKHLFEQFSPFKNAFTLPDVLNVSPIDDNTGIFTGAYDDEDVGSQADLNNLEATMNVSFIPTTRINKDHTIELIIGDLHSAPLTRRMSQQNIEEHCLEVYVCQPPGFKDPHFPDKVYKVEKALYGLHQALRARYETFSTYLIENGFRRGIIDKTLFIKKDKGDILFDAQEIPDDFYRGLTFFLGLQVQQKDDEIFISQDKYVAKILKKFDFATMKRVGASQGACDLKRTRWTSHTSKLRLSKGRTPRGVDSSVLGKRSFGKALGGSEKPSAKRERKFVEVRRILLCKELLILSLERKERRGDGEHCRHLYTATMWDDWENGFVCAVELHVQQTQKGWTRSVQAVPVGGREWGMRYNDVWGSEEGYVPDYYFYKCEWRHVSAVKRNVIEMSVLESVNGNVGVYIDYEASVRGVESDVLSMRLAMVQRDAKSVCSCQNVEYVYVKTTSTPIETNKALVKYKEAEAIDVHLYRSMIGSLMYLTASMPNMTFAVYACTRFQVTSKVSHLYAVKRIFRYLKGQPKLGLWYPRDSPFDLEAFSDCDYARASLDRKSTTREYVAAANCCGQVLWIQNQMLDYGFHFMNTKSTLIMKA